MSSEALTAARPRRRARAEGSFFRRNFPTFAEWTGNFGWPILLRQLRADFRKNRFFLSQLICLSVLGIALLIMISNEVDKGLTAAQVGRSLFSTFFCLEYLIILVIFPAFSATTFAEEKAGLTMDLLLTTNLRPAEVVWGKFLASTVYCLIYVLASIPLLSITFLFGGVSLAEVLAAYAFLVGLTLFVSMVGVAVSSCYASTVRSSLTMYVLVFLALAWSLHFYLNLPSQGRFEGVSLTVLGNLGRWLGLGPSSSVLEATAYAVVPLVIFAYLFLITSNRIRPSADDRSSALRALTFLSIPGLVAARAWAKLPWSGTGQVSAIEGVIQLAAFLLLVVTVVFSTEDAAVSRRNRVRFGKLTGVRFPLRILAPGAFWGFVYSVVLSILVCGGLLAAWETVFVDRVGPELDRVVVGSLTALPCYLAALGALGFLLAAADFTPLYSRLTVFFLFVITLLLPVIFWLSKLEDAVWTFYYLSPITLWESLQETAADAEPKFILFGLPIITVAKGIYLAAAGAFLAAGVVLARRSGYPMLRFGASSAGSAEDAA
jgi:ABC-type transport system involved in multi-copper enzyme maturation permease subunit